MTARERCLQTLLFGKPDKISLLLLGQCTRYMYMSMVFCRLFNKRTKSRFGMEIPPSRYG